LFLLSKLFWLVAQPLSLAFLLIAFSLLAGLFGWRRLRGLSAFLAALILFVTLFTSSGTVLLQELEARFPRPQEPAAASCMIVLGGGFETEVTTGRGGYELNQAGDRFTEMLRLALVHPQARILVSGGDGSLSGRYEGDAAVSERFLQAFGVDPARLVKEDASRTTFENVTNTKALLEQNGLSDCLLITSAFHMPRAIGLFRKAGIPVIPWPADYRTSGDVKLGFDFTQPSLNAQQTTTATREWIGLLAYYLTGRTDALYPG